MGTNKPKMDQEKLIEYVRLCEPLYAINHPKYSDTMYKENVWRGIAKEMNFPAAGCKKTWTSLRDSFRRALKKKRETRSGQSASKMKKWKFEDEMSFLLPFMHERETGNNLKDFSDDDNEGEPNEDESDDRKDNIGFDRNDDDKDDVDDSELHFDDERKKKQREFNRKGVFKVPRDKGSRSQVQPEPLSTILMEYLPDNKTITAQVTPPIQQSCAIDTLFSCFAATVKNFSPYYQNLAKSQLFSIISDLEMQQIMQEQQFGVPNTPAQRQHSTPVSTTIPPQSLQGYHPGQYIVPSSPLPPQSLSSTTIPTSCPSTLTVSSSIPSILHDFPTTSVPRVGEQTSCTEDTKM
ncbi:uncharacterized protein LOC105702678 [Orussus abietinus]|uniref:uncharacterized protein LOC105702678 n=1 Tax=Orussus abietinus TaxID=222816 RepID=UPI0006251E77|nr:uncharacterized protein LOC105702678 [Orussus abietinus]